MNFSFTNAAFVAALSAGNLIPAMTSASAPSGTVTAESEIPGLPAWQAFDRDGGTVWQASTSSPLFWWLGYQFDEDVTVRRYAVTADTAATAPTQMSLQGSNNGSDWTTLHSGLPSFSAGERKVYSFTNSTAYDYYRLTIDSVGVGTPRIRELELFNS